MSLPQNKWGRTKIPQGFVLIKPKSEIVVKQSWEEEVAFFSSMSSRGCQDSGVDNEEVRLSDFELI